MMIAVRNGPRMGTYSDFVLFSMHSAAAAGPLLDSPEPSAKCVARARVGSSTVQFRLLFNFVYVPRRSSSSQVAAAAVGSH